MSLNVIFKSVTNHYDFIRLFSTKYISLVNNTHIISAYTGFYTERKKRGFYELVVPIIKFDW